MQIDYNNPTDNEIRRIVAEALDAGEQVKILRHLTGKSIDEIRQICGMPKEIKKRHYRKGRPGFWDKDKIKYLYDHPNETAASLSKHFGVSQTAVTSMRYQLGIKKVTVWSEDAIRKLTLAYRNGLKPAKIAEMLDLDLYAVQKKIIAMKAAKKL